MRESILKRLRGIFDEMDFLGSECVIDSLVRIEDDNFNRCTSISECYYCVHDFPGEQILSNVRVCNPLIKLYEVR